jgi:hypothetical protein
LNLSFRQQEQAKSPNNVEDLSPKRESEPIQPKHEPALIQPTHEPKKIQLQTQPLVEPDPKPEAEPIQTRFPKSVVDEIQSKEFVHATIIDLLKKNFIKFSSEPDPVPAVSEMDEETQQLRLKIKYPTPSNPTTPSLPSFDDILSIIPSGSVTSILVTSSLPGNGFWPIPVPENER